MTILSDKTLRKLVLNDTIHIYPQPEDKQFQPSSIDLQLDYRFKRYVTSKLSCVDTKNKHLNFDRHMETIILKYRHDPYIIQPNEFVLAQTRELLRIPENMVGIIEGRSSFGRLGLLVHATAGYIDPGFEGHVTLEIKNINTMPIAIYPEQRICQLVIYEMDKKADYPYGCESLGSKYQFQDVPTPSKIMEDYKL